MTENTHKDAAIDFLLLVAAGKVRQAYDKYVSSDFRHHNAYFPGDRQGLLTAMEENATHNPDKVFEVQRALQDGSLVAVHSKVQLKPQNLTVALVHIFEFKDGLIRELWDIGQAVPEKSPNENGMF